MRNEQGRAKRGTQRTWRGAGVALVSLALLLGCMNLGTEVATVRAARPDAGVVLHIGYQAFGDLNVLKSKGTLEKALAPLGASVDWTKFTSGPPLLEAVNAGSIDVGATGDSPPIFAQAAGVPLVYIAAQPSSPATEAILVPANSPIHSVSQLRGKKVAVAQASSAHYLLVAALAAAHVPYNSIHAVYLQPADARAAFEQGSVDAWSIWDPYYAMEQHATSVRVLTTGAGVDLDLSYYLASRSFATAHPDIIRLLLKQLKGIDAWITHNKGQVATFLSPQVGIDVPSLTTELNRSHYGVGPISNAAIVLQQSVADTFLSLKLIPHKIHVADVIWTQATQSF